MGRGRRVRRIATQLARFALLELAACAFPLLFFLALAVTSVVDLPLARYDVLLLVGIALTLGFKLLGLESWREVWVIAGFHVLGLALELFKVRSGSWAYPGDAVTKVAGVPLYAGFMYAAVGSYICQAWRRFELRVTRYPALPTSVLAVLAYLNFFTHHAIVDLRWPIAIGFVVVLWRTAVHFTVAGRRYRMPLSVSFVLIGGFLWLAENAATFLGAYRYPDQSDVWRLVHPGKLGSWSLLVSLSFVLVATVKAQEGRLYGVPGAVPSVEEDDAGDDR